MSEWISIDDRLPTTVNDYTGSIACLAWNKVRMEPVLATLVDGSLPFDVWNEGWDHAGEISHFCELPPKAPYFNGA